jgi:diguanylate cyclase (GGDEF)-like protein/PAS domain S-box-containing protein
MDRRRPRSNTDRLAPARVKAGTVRPITLLMNIRQSLSVRGRIAGVARGGLPTLLMAILVVLAMIGAAAFARRTADQHRQAQVLAEQVHASFEELLAFKWQTDTEILQGSANFSLTSPLVREGLRVMTQLTEEVARLHRLVPAADTDRLQRDVNNLYAASLHMLAVVRNPKLRALPGGTLNTFEPALHRMDDDARLTAAHQRKVAAGALELAWIGSIGSLLLGIGVLSVLAWRLARLRRRTELAEEVRTVERRSEQRIRALVERSRDVVTVLDRDLRVRWQAPSIKRLLGEDPDHLLGTPIADIVHRDDRDLFVEFVQASIDGRAPSTLRARFHHTDGRWCHAEIVAENLFADPAVEGLVLNIRDISERKAFEDELRHQAFHDALTGLANRALFEDRLRHALAGTLRTRKTLAVLFLDLDDFKTINDSLGHRAGDSLLRGVAARIDSLIRPTDTAARLGGDEFAVLVNHVETQEEAEAMARRLLDALGQRFVIDGRELAVTASIGVALGEGSVPADELLRNADIAMYAAKAAGKNAVHAFKQTMHKRAVERLELRNELGAAIEAGEFVLEYQPIVSLPTGAAVGVEALVRWEHPVRGRLAPGQFIGLAEETGLIVGLGRWVLEQACRQLQEWKRALEPSRDLYISVNVSIRQLYEEDFVDIVGEALDRSAIDPHSLVLEITEGLLADDRDAIVRRLQALKMLGVRIAVDDFGTGYSALSHLQQFPIDILKIDKSFIDGLDGDDQKANLVAGIINLGESLSLDVIAEGIEQRHQADRLRAMRSALAQGFLFSRPLEPGDLLAVLQDASRLLAAG